MDGGSLSAAQGPLFFVTNTRGIIHLQNVKLSAASGVLVNAAASRWGRSGSNGGHVELTAENQKLAGDITVDKVSSAIGRVEESFRAQRRGAERGACP